jgi:hypothetical protein
MRKDIVEFQVIYQSESNVLAFGRKLFDTIFHL